MPPACNFPAWRVSARGQSTDSTLPGAGPGSGVGPYPQDRNVVRPLRRAFGACPTSISNVARDEVRAIIGPNGAGKSTFFNCLTGVLRPTVGPHRVQWRRDHRPAFQCDLAKGHRPLLSDHQHPAQRLGAGERAHRRAIAPAWLESAARPCASPDINEKAEAALNSVGLLGKADELAANLSHGEQRNLEIGIALATKPRLLLPRRTDRGHERRPKPMRRWSSCAASPRMSPS